MLDFSTSGVGSGLLSSAAGAAGRAANYQPPQIAAAGYAPVAARAVDPVTYQPAISTTSNFQGVAPASAGAASLAQGAQVDRNAIRDVGGGGSITADQISAYLNPYTQDVVNASMADLERQRSLQQEQNAADARRAHAFGGTGAAMTAGLTNDSFARQMAQSIAQLRSQGYDSALAAAQGDAGRSLQAALANQRTDLSAAGTNAQLANAASLANQAALNQRGEFNANLAQQGALANQSAANAAYLADADAANRIAQANAQGYLQAGTTNAGIQQSMVQSNAAAANQAAQFGAQMNYDAQLANQQAGQAAMGLNLQGASALAGFSDQQRNQLLQDIAQAQSVGDAQQKVQQALLDTGYSEYQAAQQWPITMQQLLNSAIGLMGNPVLNRSSDTRIGLPQSWTGSAATPLPQ